MESERKFIRRSKSADVGVLAKVLRIFDALHESPSGLNLKQIGDQTKLNKSTAYRFLSHLEREGYLVRDERGVYILGMRLFELASISSHQAALRKLAQPALRNLQKVTGETVNLGVLHGTMVVYVDVLESPHEFRLVSRVGLYRPLYATALGKSLLAFLQSDRREELLRNIQLRPLTPSTISTPLRFRKELYLIRERGYALDDEESYLGARCVAAPILDSDGEAEAAISVAGPTCRITDDRVPLFASAVREAVQRISERISFSRTSRHDHKFRYDA